MKTYMKNREYYAIIVKDKQQWCILNNLYVKEFSLKEKFIKIKPKQNKKGIIPPYPLKNQII